MQKKILHLLLLFTFAICFSQSKKKVDSLETVLKKYDLKSNPVLSLFDSVKVKTLNELSFTFIDYNPEKAISYSKEALALALKIKFEKGIGTSYSNLGRIYNNMGNHQMAIDYINKSIVKFQQTGNEIGLSNSYNELGIVFSKMGNYPEAIKNNISALKLYEKQKNKYAISSAYVNIGLLYKQQQDYDKALQNYFKALETVKNENNEDGNYVRAFTYNNMGHLYLKQKKTEEALNILLSAKKIGAPFNNSYFDSDTNKAIGDCYLSKENYSKALDLYNESLQQSIKNEDQVGISESYINIGYANFKQGNSSKAIENSNKGLAIAKKIGQLEWQKNAYQNLAEIYNTTKNYKLAYDNQVLFKQANDSMFNTEKNKKVTELQLTYEFDKKQEATKIQQQKKDAILELEAKKQRMTTYFVLLALIFVSGFAFWIYYNLKQNQKQKKIIEEQKSLVETQNEQIQHSLTEKETLLREIHHRVKNNLQIISSLLNIQSQDIKDENVLSSIQEGQSRVQAMSLIHQNLYQSEHLNNVDIENYLRELVVYLSGMFEGSSKSINVSIETSGIQFDIDTAIPLGLIVNELVSNAYKYAFESNQKGNIHINIKSINDIEYELNVNNDGKSLPEDFDSKKTKSLGLKLVSILSRQLRGGLSAKSDKGITSFVVSFKDLKAYQTSLN